MGLNQVGGELLSKLLKLSVMVLDLRGEDEPAPGNGSQAGLGGGGG
jgi:hypothetical protein